jgi:A/G-specific adenine glycosylase
VKSRAKEKRVEARDVLVILDAENRVLLRRRTERLLHNLFEFPSAMDGLEPDTIVKIGEAEHVFTHIRWQMKGQLWRTRECPAPEGLVWVSKNEWHSFAVPSAFRFFVKRLEREWM